MPLGSKAIERLVYYECRLPTLPHPQKEGLMSLCSEAIGRVVYYIVLPLPQKGGWASLRFEAIGRLVYY